MYLRKNKRQKFVPKEIPVMPDSDLLKKANLNIESDNRIHLIGYRFDATGVFGYSFYKANEEICSVSSIVAPSAPVLIHDGNVAWSSNFDIQSTIVPGLTRTINDESNGKQECKIVYNDSGQNEINETVFVYCCNGKYVFCIDNSVIAVISRIENQSDYFPKPLKPYDDYDYEPYFDFVSLIDIEHKLLIAILAFPMLKFGL